MKSKLRLGVNLRSSHDQVKAKTKLKIESASGASRSGLPITVVSHAAPELTPAGAGLIARGGKGAQERPCDYLGGPNYDGWLVFNNRVRFSFDF